MANILWIRRGFEALLRTGADRPALVVDFNAISVSVPVAVIVATEPEGSGCSGFADS